MAFALRTLKIINKLIGFLVAATAIILAVVNIFTNTFNLITLIRTVYIGIFAVVLILAQLNFAFFLNYFNFLEKSLGKGLYIIFLGSVLLNGVLYVTIIGFLVMLFGVIYILIGRKINKEERLTTEDQSKIKQPKQTTA